MVKCLKLCEKFKVRGAVPRPGRVCPNRVAGGASIAHVLHICSDFFDILPRYLASCAVKIFSSGHRFGIETGRWDDTPREELVCRLCKLGEASWAKTKGIFFFQCSLYFSLRLPFVPSCRSMEQLFSQCLVNRCVWSV